jgi:hypothetical protein
LQEHRDATGSPRAFIELDVGVIPAEDTASVESLAVWAYGYDEGALLNRRCVVVFDEADEAECARRWRHDFQNLFFLTPRDYLHKFLNVAAGQTSVPPTPATMAPPQILQTIPPASKEA